MYNDALLTRESTMGLPILRSSLPILSEPVSEEE